MTQPTSSADFTNLGISPKLQEILQQLAFTVPTPIQQQAIPAGIAGKDIVGIAQTGTGKTLAFGIPMIQALGRNKGNGLIIVPTRELALQVDETFQQIGRKLGLRTAVLIGGASMYHQKTMIKANPHVIIATPGRLIDHLKQKTVGLRNVKFLVLDEADHMFDMGFAPQIKQVLEHVPKDRQTLLFSATMPPAIAKLAEVHMRQPMRIEIARAGTPAQKIDQKVYIVKKDNKRQLLDTLLEKHTGAVLVFSRTKHGARKICKTVRGMGHSSAEIHSNCTLAQRRKALDGFKSGAYRVLVATDIAARGIDVNDIELVINYDLPDNSEDYVHRIGRTGRAGKTGQAISFATPDQQADIRSIERLIRTQLPITRHS